MAISSRNHWLVLIYLNVVYCLLCIVRTLYVYSLIPRALVLLAFKQFTVTLFIFYTGRPVNCGTGKRHVKLL